MSKQNLIYNAKKNEQLEELLAFTAKLEGKVDEVRVDLNNLSTIKPVIQENSEKIELNRVKFEEANEEIDDRIVSTNDRIDMHDDNLKRIEKDNELEK